MAPILEMLPELFSLSGIGLIVLASVLLTFIINKTVYKVPYPKNIPLIGEPEGARHFSVSTALRYYSDCSGLFRDAYDNVRTGHRAPSPTPQRTRQLTASPR